uniref:Small ribosomal subunit protein uS17 N-terminal domain-containing protein n=1 Tax=Aegilops tauschii subsp. strangulata TaxID=200361 RepID=A0A453P2W4_AEGTS
GYSSRLSPPSTCRRRPHRLRASAMAEQTEKAFLKQPKVFLCSKKTTKGNNKPGKEGNRFWKSVGLGFKTPKEAIEGLFCHSFFQL